MPRRYPPELRCKALELLAAGQSVRKVAQQLQLSDQTIYHWRRTYMPTAVNWRSPLSVQAGLAATRRRICELENELAVYRRVGRLLSDAVSLEDGTRQPL